MSEVTIFEKIIAKEIPAEIVFENDRVLAFKDINPQAEVHILFIHKNKSVDLNDMMKNYPEHSQDILSAIHQYTIQEKINDRGFRVLTNIGRGGGQTVFYTHFHLLSGSDFGHFGRV